MRDKCFDEGMIQAFFDGELEAGLLEQVARHVSDCEPCAVLMSDIEAESASVTAAFEIENFELVPTERLRTKIFAEIEVLENGRASWLKKAAGALGLYGGSGGFKWISPQLAAFASLVFVVGVVALVLTNKPQEAVQIASSAGRPAPVESKIAAPPAVNTPPEEENIPGPKMARPVSYVEPRAAERVVKPVSASLEPLQDEQRYLSTIDTLKRSVDDRKYKMLKPSKLVSYERDMAIVDDAIRKMQKIARKNPKDDASKQLLLASYQNKIDLLSAVSEKTELMASLR